MNQNARQRKAALAEWARLWQGARDAAESRGAPNPDACADRYIQGLNLAHTISQTS